MSTTLVPQRHAFGLPAGSVRALLAFGVLGYLWVLVLRPGQEGFTLDAEASLAFIYLQFLMVLILGHFFTAHGRNIGARVSQRSPLGLPTGSVRLLLLAGYLGMAYFMWKNNSKFEIPDTGPVVLLLLVLATAFFVGHYLSKVMKILGGGVVPAWFQDVQATLALVALLLLGAVVLIRLVINQSLPLADQIGLNNVEAVLAGLVGFYFGARS